MQAWGSLADSKWKELLAIVEAEDLVFAPESDFSTVGNSPTALPSNISLNKAHVKQMSDSNAAARKSGTTKYSNGESTTKVTEVGVTTSHKKLHRRRPLLILFSHHNKPEPLGAYRAMILAERYCML